MSDDELYTLIRENYTEVNKEYIEEQIKTAVQYMGDLKGVVQRAMEEDIKSQGKTDKLARTLRNIALLEKYPWLTPYNVWTGKPLEDYDYEYTRADDIPRGWRTAFGDQMLEELDQLLKKYNFEKEYRIAQIKEKFGGLRWYDDGFPEEGWEEYNAWLYKYEDLSFKTCMSCGKPAIGLTKGWIMPLCKDCMKDMPYDPIGEE